MGMGRPGCGAGTVKLWTAIGAQLELRPACRHGAQDGPVASAEGARGGHGGLRGCAAGVVWDTFSL